MRRLVTGWPMGVALSWVCRSDDGHADYKVST